ncbi:hypothetical protein F4818DRAFT_180858 [Hypoxylon cercidicola]|nr:hypothetical protein F4818DRAFT_180858 [Hypoxylon cercidicola]
MEDEMVPTGQLPSGLWSLSKEQLIQQNEARGISIALENGKAMTKPQLLGARCLWEMGLTHVSDEVVDVVFELVNSTIPVMLDYNSRIGGDQITAHSKSAVMVSIMRAIKGLGEKSSLPPLTGGKGRTDASGTPTGTSEYPLLPHSSRQPPPGTSQPSRNPRQPPPDSSHAQGEESEENYTTDILDATVDFVKTIRGLLPERFPPDPRIEKHRARAAEMLVRTGNSMTAMADRIQAFDDSYKELVASFKQLSTDVDDMKAAMDEAGLGGEDA